MGEIKFRSWVESEKYSYMNYNIEFTGGLINDIFATSGKESQSPYGNKITYMQYTGLKDQNDKEIYEDDVLDVCGNKVVVRKGRHEYDSVRILKGCRPLEVFGYYVESPCGSWQCNINVAKNLGMKIIGNIYENKDLIK